jgi:hypothetical protein
VLGTVLDPGGVGEEGGGGDEGGQLAGEMAGEGGSRINQRRSRVSRPRHKQEL